MALPRPWRRPSAAHQRRLDRVTQGRRPQRGAVARPTTHIRDRARIFGLGLADDRRITRSHDGANNASLLTSDGRPLARGNRARQHHHHGQGAGRNPSPQQAGAAMKPPDYRPYTPYIDSLLKVADAHAPGARVELEQALEIAWALAF